ncbi:hypothetical protein OG2516_08668 [Oceanicola granulosus HTCC2516]|uniref:VOC domain-containing protein n=1 Tax=Oceanicola granulosus (strain ATCC BAA-861 / DSM 15982 / KCTC 12143 / HTCC2516) TaxID=314256 RepID=Q2CAW2_OCEGH|nr:hypothetical protein OG2516_08668 [Oceanicola granulosus HTCC2516]
MACSSLTESIDWYTELFEREPDNLPMIGMAEWEHGHSGGLQLVEDVDNAGSSAVTLMVADLDKTHARLEEAEIDTGEIEEGDYTRFVRLADPDDNEVIVATENL